MEKKRRREKEPGDALRDARARRHEHHELAAANAKALAEKQNWEHRGSVISFDDRGRRVVKVSSQHRASGESSEKVLSLAHRAHGAILSGDQYARRLLRAKQADAGAATMTVHAPSCVFDRCPTRR